MNLVLLTVEHELHDCEQRLGESAHPQQLDDVGVLEPLHDLGLGEEVPLLLHRRVQLEGLHRHGTLTKERDQHGPSVAATGSTRGHGVNKGSRGQHGVTGSTWGHGVNSRQ